MNEERWAHRVTYDASCLAVAALGGHSLGEGDRGDAAWLRDDDVALAAAAALAHLLEEILCMRGVNERCEGEV